MELLDAITPIVDSQRVVNETINFSTFCMCMFFPYTLVLILSSSQWTLFLGSFGINFLGEILKVCNSLMEFVRVMTPVSSLFIHELKGYWLQSSVIRNSIEPYLGVAEWGWKP